MPDADPTDDDDLDMCDIVLADTDETPDEDLPVATGGVA